MNLKKSKSKLKNDYEEMYTVFSGGDDFFLIGPWNKTIKFVREVRKQFSSFCASNPDLTFSAGVILCKPHEPISFCANAVENTLRDSKRQEGKDAIIYIALADFEKKIRDVLNVFCDENGKVDAEDCLKCVVWAWLLGLENGKREKAKERFRHSSEGGESKFA